VLLVPVGTLEASASDFAFSALK